MTQYFGNQVVGREIPRAQVYALFALNGSEQQQPNNVSFREYRHTTGQYVDNQVYRIIDVEVDDEAVGRHWARVFGIDEKPSWGREYDDGAAIHYQWHGTWHGFTVEIETEVRPGGLPSTLDDATREQLQPLVERLGHLLAADEPGAVVCGE